MNVKELIKILQRCDEDSIVVLSNDSEDNSYSPLDEVDDSSNYKADTTYSGEVGIRKLTEELIELGFGEEDVVEGEKAVVLFPIN